MSMSTFHKKFHKKPLSLFCFMLSSSVLAQTSETVPLEITVTTPLRAPQALNETQAATTVITREHIEQSQADSVAQVLRGQPGVEFASNGSTSSLTSIFLRGSNSNHTLVLVDGIKINNPTDGTVSFQFVPVDQIERIEIIRGPQSSAWGADAIGGVINIITRKSTLPGSSGSWTAGLGQNNSEFGSLNFSFADEQTRLNTGMSYRHSSGFNNTTADVSGEDDGHNSKAFNVQFEHQFNDQQRINVSHIQTHGRNQYDCFDTPDCVQKFRFSTSQIGWQQQVNALWSIQARVQRLLEDRRDFRQQADNGRFDSRRDTLSLGTNYNSAIALWSFGAEWNQTKIDAARFGSFSSITANERENGGIFSQLSYDLSHALTLNLGTRWDHDEFYGNYTTTNLGVRYDLNTAHTLGASYSQGFRSPTMLDLYGGFGGNTELNPEESDNFEVFWRYQSDQQRAQGHTLEMRAFQNQISNLIAWQFTGPGDFQGQNFNIGKAQIQGVEVSHLYRLQHWSVNTALTLQDPVDEDADSQLLRRAKEIARVDLDYQVHRWSAGVTLEGQGDRQDFADTTLDAYLLTHLRANWYLTPDLTLRAKLDNVTDKDYQQANGFNTQGRYAEAQLSYQF